MFEFVSKQEYMPIRIEIENILRKIQKSLKNINPDLTFQFKLIGSGKRHLITRIKNGNDGYDFDYNLVLNPKFERKPNVRKEFFNALKLAIKGTIFNKIEDSTSTITIKKVSHKDKKVIVGCDFSIIYYPNDSVSGHYMYSRLNKNQNNYAWQIRNISRFNDDKLNHLKNHYENIWEDIKSEYLKLKEKNRQQKHSFILFHEAINNVYNHLKITMILDDKIVL